MNPLRITVISDVICPWCYIGKRRLEASLRKLGEGSAPEILWSAFQLNPDMPEQGMERKAYRSAKFGSWEESQAKDAEVARVGRSEDIQFNFAGIERTPNTLAAHRVIWFARRFAKQNEVVEELFRRYFIDGHDIGNREVLIEAASECKLPSKLTRELLRGEEGSAEVARESEVARHLGICAVPTFILNGSLAISGAQTPDALLAAFSRADVDAAAEAEDRGARI